MKALHKLCLFSALLALPSYAQSAEAQKATPNCPMTGTIQKNMGAMQSDMGVMMQNMNMMMASAGDPAMKARMQKMHDQMGMMMTGMQKMNGGIMGGGMMQNGKAPDSAPSGASKPEDHAAHHPN